MKLRSFPQRLGSALALLIGMWLLAVPLVFVPVVHFFAVPALIVGAPLAAFFAYRHQGMILSVVVSCPDCAAAASIAGRALRFPLYLSCDCCGQRICLDAAPFPEAQSAKGSWST